MEISDYIAICSVVIALSAMGVAIWQGYLARIHNQLSVQPKLQVNTDIRNGLLYTLENQGLGPAIVKSFFIHIDGKTIENPEEDPFQIIFEGLEVDPFVKKFGYEFHLPTVGTTYKAGLEKRLLEVTPAIEDFDRNVLKIIRQKIVIQIDYSCIYDKVNYQCLIGGT
ncbi:MAG: hypothetical protein ABJD02_12425 [Paraglaciecola sp.]|uniref:hypothetical protein n=1 Tax=Paraglaciecola sp. TaxID=1920173 RepID=UPI003267822A